MIKVRVTSGVWLRCGEQAIVRRIATVVVGTDEGVQLEIGSGSGCSSVHRGDTYWHLKYIGNNWWASRMDAHGVIEIDYRCGGGGNAPAMKALEIFLNWLFQNE